MGKFLTAVVIAATAILMTTSAQAGETKDTKSQQTTKAAKDPNYRWHNGQWWYWMPKQKNWMVWTGDAWLPQEQARKQGAVRSFSYDEQDGQANQGGTYYGEGIQRMFGTPLSRVPNSVSNNNQIIGSYGFRRAGAKMIGNY